MNNYPYDMSLRSRSRKQAAMSRTIDLYGRTPDGRPNLWKRAVLVEPVSAFERTGRWIASGHYVIDHDGVAITVHCANADDGNVSVQFMHDESSSCVLPRSAVESMLLGKVAVSVEQQAAVFEGRRLSDFFADAELPDEADDNRPWFRRSWPARR
nr:hypothetical protein [uncultured Rhodopila sp.]